jgi:hypothetical protein
VRSSPLPPPPPPSSSSSPPLPPSSASSSLLPHGREGYQLGGSRSSQRESPTSVDAAGPQALSSALAPASAGSPQRVAVGKRTFEGACLSYARGKRQMLARNDEVSGEELK